MRSPARLNGGDLPRLPHVADVEDPHRRGNRSALTGCLDALRSAVDAAARLLDRHDQQVAVDGHVALAARADDRRDEPRLARVLDVIGVEPVEVTDEEVLPLEREIGVGEVQRRSAAAAASRGWRRLRERPAPARAGWCRAAVLGGVGSPAGAFGSKKPSGFGIVATQLQVPRRLPASRSPGFKPTARIGGCIVGGPARAPILRAPQDSAASNAAPPYPGTLAADLISEAP